jgi:hypothetical protein
VRQVADARKWVDHAQRELTSRAVSFNNSLVVPRGLFERLSRGLSLPEIAEASTQLNKWFELTELSTRVTTAFDFTKQFATTPLIDIWRDVERMASNFSRLANTSLREVRLPTDINDISVVANVEEPDEVRLAGSIRDCGPAVSGTDRQMAGIHRWRPPAALAGRRQGTLHHFPEREAHGRATYDSWLNLRSGKARGAVSNADRSWHQPVQTSIRRLARRQVPDQRVEKRRFANHFYPQLEAASEVNACVVREKTAENALDLFPARLGIVKRRSDLAIRADAFARVLSLHPI